MKNITVCASSQPSFSIYHSFSITTLLAELRMVSGGMAKKAVKSKLHTLTIQMLKASYVQGCHFY